ncbi:MAG TPA: S41 family peptidase [Planctomycetota bacterium]|nr:S41 family peptidase [Planctomycetota bacterium]
MIDRRPPPLLTFLMPVFALLFGLAGLAMGWQIWGRHNQAGNMGKIRVALDRIEKHYFPGLTVETAVDGALEGITAKLDPYCEYFTKQEYKEFRENSLDGKFGGVGIRVGLDRATGFVLVETPIEDTPAFSADILPGDLIREVDGKTTKGQPLQEIVRRIKGDPDTSVTLTMFRKGRDPFKVTLVRKIIELKTVKTRMLPDSLGYIRITEFSKIMKTFDAEVKKLMDQGAKGLIIDLRFNPGGLLEECVELADRFLEDGIIVTTRGRTDDDLREITAKKDGTLPPIPLVVLINGGSASASEIFSGAMKDRGRGTIVGERSFGKGSVQTPYPLGDGSNLKITTARYFTPNGTSVHKEEGKKEWGVTPDFTVEMSPEEYSKLMKTWSDESYVKGEKPATPEGFRDFQLDTAVEVLKAKIDKREPKVEARILKKEAKTQED